MDDNLFEGNRLDIARNPAFHVRGAGLEVRSIGPGNRVILLRNRFFDNGGGGSHFTQVMLTTLRGSLIHFGDSVVAASKVGGVAALNGAGGIIHLTNLTVADNGWMAVWAAPWRTDSFPGDPADHVLSLANSIVVGPVGAALLEPGPNEKTSFVKVANLVGKTANPRFRNRALQDYRLLPRSGAVDKGTANPPGGLGPTDVTGGPRRLGRNVDQGAYESF